jgi:hypothetical protein
LVDLFGTKKYIDRIGELESLVSKLAEEKLEQSSQLEKREEKIRKLTSAYQEANLALKAAEKKASSSLTMPQKADEEMKISQTVHGLRLRPTEVDKLLERLDAIRSPEDDLLTAYLKSPVDLPPEAEKLAGSIKSDRGMAVLHCPFIFTLALVPPLPVTQSPPAFGSVFLLDQLRDFMETPVLVISAHAGDTFIGLALTKSDFEIQEQVESPVKEKHSKGGWSQKRFERLREEDIRNHADAVVQKVGEMSVRFKSIARYAVIGGDPALLRMILPSLDLPVVERKLERHDERRPDKLLEEVYSFYCYRRLPELKE